MVTTAHADANLPGTTGMSSKITGVDVTNKDNQETVHHVSVDTVMVKDINEQKDEEDEE